MAEKTAQALWKDYRFLTREMKKFLSQQNMDLFYELMNQRERLQSMITQTPDEGFRVSLDGKSCFVEIQQNNQYIVKHLRMQFNKSKISHQVAEIYNGATNSEQASRMNWKG